MFILLNNHPIKIQNLSTPETNHILLNFKPSDAIWTVNVCSAVNFKLVFFLSEIANALNA